MVAKLGFQYLGKEDALFLRLPLQFTTRTSSDWWTFDVVLQGVRP